MEPVACLRKADGQDEVEWEDLIIHFVKGMWAVKMTQCLIKTVVVISIAEEGACRQGGPSQRIPRRPLRLRLASH